MDIETELVFSFLILSFDVMLCKAKLVLAQPSYLGLRSRRLETFRGLGT
jgi:hypothetical protein